MCYYNPVNRMLPDDIRLAAVATPVLSIVVSLARSATIAAAFVAPVERRLAAVATPVVSIVVSLALSATIAAAFVAPVERRLAAVATPVVSIVEMRLLRFPGCVVDPCP